MRSTGHAPSPSGPKLNAVEMCPSRENSLSANRRYPCKGSKTYCHGRIDLGRRMKTGCLLRKPRIKSGINRSTDQSPPPITLPARAVASATRGSSGEHTEKKELRYVAHTISAQALLEE